MSEHQKQTAFFKALFQADASTEQRQLRDRILKAENDVRCCRRAMFKVLALVAIALVSGLYAAVITPEVVLQADNSLRKFLEIVSIGSLLALASYAGFWLYYRALLFQVHNECRRFLVSFLAHRQQQREATSFRQLTLSH